MRLALSLPFVLVGEVCHHVTWVCDEIAARLTSTQLPVLPEGGFTSGYTSR